MEQNKAPSRRMVLKVAGAAVTVTFLAGCGGQGNDSAAAPIDTAEVRAAVEKAVSAGTVPVGGAQFLSDAGVVVTQPTKGDYRVFSDVCPHQNGRVSIVDKGTGRLVCALHGSQFNPATGAAEVGPASTGLTPVEVPVSGSTG
ncbi:Rieske (2Fe-2S) protein [Gephyromycinifex aptenodytis]|uniref:Rieske (2Fe-2S) protein n=1 Tax=Gephyromycinifex aptenodytis TaxID=2716227 RepID=UPI001D013960|nr:Rieske (2Fe-2S) protein [Gephyromycinifex aptenodytis]